MKHLKILFVTFSTIALSSCSSSRYLAELPYHYPTDAFYKAVLAQKKQINEQYTLVDDKGENLSDKELALREKYSIILAVPPKKITNYKLYAFIDEWIGTPYETTFPKTPDGIFRSKDLQLFTGRTYLKEGDILFFRYDKFKPISDVGLYLGNGRILACTTQGLNIYDFNDEYFQKRYTSAGRLKEKK